MFCERCGTRLENDDVFCPVCGCAVGSGETADQGGARKRRKRRFILPIVLIMLSVFCAAATVYMINKDKQEEKIQEQEEEETAEIAESESTLKVETKEKVEEDSIEKNNGMDEVQRDYTRLESALTEYCNTNMDGANYSFYFASLDDGYEYELNTHASRAGASGRIFVIEYIVNAVKKGTMQSSDTILDIIRTTATGEEPSSYRLVEQITGNYAEGLDLVREYVKDRGYDTTSINRFNGDSGSHSVNSPNQTSAKDTGKSMAYIYEEALNGNSFASQVLEILGSDASSKNGIASTVRQKASKAVAYNFPGSYVECENDAAIVKIGDEAYIISFMMGDLHVSDGLQEQAMECMHGLTGIVCDNMDITS